MQITDEMIEAAWLRYQKSLETDSSTGELSMRAALEAALGTAIKQSVRIQDPRVLAESLIGLGPSSDGAVERDLRHALEQQAACIEDLAAALREVERHDIDKPGLGYPDLESVIRSAVGAARATLEKWGLK